jgi:hypothetical protein
MKHNVLAFAGAAVGGAIGYFAFFWIAAQGFYALALPGALLGFGAGIVTTRSIWVAVASGVAATALGIFTEFRFAPFRDDPSFGFFLANLSQLRPITLIMIALGGLIGFWVPFHRRESH